jgi:hypothetical protein
MNHHFQDRRKSMTMAKKITTILAAAAFAGALSLPMATSADPGPATAKATGVTAAPAVPQPRERHPEIRDAVRLLTQAQDRLSHAAHDFGGHRVKAMQHISEALEELHAAQASDRR